MRKSIFVFFHIEKCGGTSLVEFFRSNLPFQACEAVSKTNAFTRSELEKSLKVYPRLRVLSGHNLQVEILDWLQEMGYTARSFTILRDPIERTISDYLHDYRKGTFDGGLRDYADIPWKQNYLARFLGSGDVERAVSNMEKIDAIVDIRHSAAYVSELLNNNDVAMRHAYAIANRAGGELPRDVAVSAGVDVGRYRIAKDCHARLLEANQIDLEIWARLKSEALSGGYECQVREQQLAQSLGGLSKRAASLYRNFLYKPSIGIWSRYYALPRNRFDPSKIAPETAFK